MNPQRTIPAVLALVIVPIALAFAGASFKTAALSIGIFWGCLAIFFYPSLEDYLKDVRSRDTD